MAMPAPAAAAASNADGQKPVYLYRPRLMMARMTQPIATSNLCGSNGHLHKLLCKSLWKASASFKHNIHLRCFLRLRLARRDLGNFATRCAAPVTQALRLVFRLTRLWVFHHLLHTSARLTRRHGAARGDVLLLRSLTNDGLCYGLCFLRPTGSL